MEDRIENEVEARRTNEWIAASEQSFGAGNAPSVYVCECSAPHCEATISLTPDEYEAARETGMRFVICTNHENPQLDYVVVQGDGFAIIEALPGHPARVARETDPRAHDC